MPRRDSDPASPVLRCRLVPPYHQWTMAIERPKSRRPNLKPEDVRVRSRRPGEEAPQAEGLILGPKAAKALKDLRDKQAR